MSLILPSKATLTDEQAHTYMHKLLADMRQAVALIYSLPTSFRPAKRPTGPCSFCPAKSLPEN